MLLQLPSIPDNAIIEYQVVIPYSVLSAPQNTFTYFWKTDGNTNSLGIPGGYYVCGTCIRVIDQFKGGTITSLTCSLGAFVPGTILSDITYYGMAYELTALPSSQSFRFPVMGRPSRGFFMAWLTRPKTPEERIAARCRELSDAIRNRR